MSKYFRILIVITIAALGSVVYARADEDASITVPQTSKVSEQPKAAQTPPPPSPAPVAGASVQTASNPRTAKPTVAKPAPQPVFGINWSGTTPTYAQGGMLNGLACAPTSVAMVAGHFQRVSGTGARTPSEMVANLQPNDFVPGQGVPYQKLVPQLRAMGYTRLSSSSGNSQASLVGSLQSGPVIVTTGGDAVGRRGSHSLVVVGISNDRGAVLVHDSRTGGRHQLSWATFDSLWAGGSRGMVIIRP